MAANLGYSVPETPRVRYAYSLAKRGESARATQLLEDAERAARTRIDAGDQTPHWRVEVAAILALRMQNHSAIDELSRAFEAGYREYGVLERDPIFAPIRGDQRFRSLLDRMRTDVEAQRRRARERGLLDLDALMQPEK
jgi:hypothetical protein